MAALPVRRIVSDDAATERELPVRGGITRFLDRQSEQQWYTDLTTCRTSWNHARRLPAQRPDWPRIVHGGGLSAVTLGNAGRGGEGARS